MPVIAIVNNKGGVAKTTTSINLAAGLVGEGRRVLLIDLDSQASASLAMGFRREQLFPSVADLLLEQRPIKQLIRQTSMDGLDMVTGSMELANADLTLANATGREFRLQRCLEAVRDDYSYIILDCPPSLSLVPVNALVAADYYLVPVVTHYLSIEGLVNLTDAVELIRKGIGTRVQCLGILLTLVDYRTKVAGEIVTMIRSHYGDKVFQTEIRVNVRLQEAPSHGKTIFQYDWASKGARAYQNLAQEVQSRCLREVQHEQARITGGTTVLETRAAG